MSDPSQPRSVNEWLSASAPPGDAVELMCECGQTTCRSFFLMTASRYERLRRSHGRLLVVAEHVDEAVFVVDRRWPEAVLVHVRADVAPGDAA